MTYQEWYTLQQFKNEGQKLAHLEGVSFDTISTIDQELFFGLQNKWRRKLAPKYQQLPAKIVIAQQEYVQVNIAELTVSQFADLEAVNMIADEYQRYLSLLTLLYQVPGGYDNSLSQVPVFEKQEWSLINLMLTAAINEYYDYKLQWPKIWSAASEPDATGGSYQSLGAVESFEEDFAHFTHLIMLVAGDNMVANYQLILQMNIGEFLYLASYLIAKNKAEKQIMRQQNKKK
jgi:hypothetical protein